MPTAGTLLTAPLLRLLGPRTLVLGSTAASVSANLVLAHTTTDGLAYAGIAPAMLGAGKAQPVSARIVNLATEAGVPQGALAAERSTLNALVKVVAPSVFAWGRYVETKAGPATARPEWRPAGPAGLTGASRCPRMPQAAPRLPQAPAQPRPISLYACAARPAAIGPISDLGGPSRTVRSAAYSPCPSTSPPYCWRSPRCSPPPCPPPSGAAMPRPARAQRPPPPLRAKTRALAAARRPPRSRAAGAALPQPRAPLKRTPQGVRWRHACTVNLYGFLCVQLSSFTCVHWVGQDFFDNLSHPAVTP